MAIISVHFRPDLIQYDKLQKSNPMYNLQNAFQVAEEKLGITPLLDPEGKTCLYQYIPVRQCISVVLKHLRF